MARIVSAVVFLVLLASVFTAPAPQMEERPTNEEVVQRAKDTGRIPQDAVVQSIMTATNTGNHVYTDGIDQPLDLYSSLLNALPSNEFNRGNFDISFLRYTK